MHGPENSEEMEHLSPSSKPLYSVTSLLLLIASLDCGVSPGSGVLTRSELDSTWGAAPCSGGSCFPYSEPCVSSFPDTSKHRVLRQKGRRDHPNR